MEVGNAVRDCKTDFSVYLRHAYSLIFRFLYCARERNIDRGIVHPICGLNGKIRTKVEILPDLA